jgi:hypothetical protein
MKRNGLMLMTMIIALIMSTVGVAAAQTGPPSGQDGILDTDTLNVEVQDRVGPLLVDYADGSPYCVPPFGATYVLEFTNQGTTTEVFYVSDMQTTAVLTGSRSVGPGETVTYHLDPEYLGSTWEDDIQGVVRTPRVTHGTYGGELLWSDTIDPNAVCAPDVEIAFVDADPSPVDVGDDFDVSVQLTNAGASVDNLTVGFELERTLGIELGDLTLEYNDGGTWTPLDFSEDNGVLYLYFGPAGGFEVGNGYNRTTEFRANFKVAATFTGTVYAIDLDA